MGRKLYVGNLKFDVHNTDLETLFEPHGIVKSVEIVIDRDTGRSRGFGFIEMASEGEAQAAIVALNGIEFKGRSLTVNVARASGLDGDDHTLPPRASGLDGDDHTLPPRGGNTV
ncbi:MAG TPA: RNA-binding protein [Gemmataceae bacterium]|nr:RNA-binding protein [Gemmataceae bacterium]